MLPLVALLGSGCGLLIEPEIPYDASASALDAGVDARVDVPSQDRPDAATDVPTDLASDASTEAAVDVPTDVPTDVAVDVPLDVAVDVPTDAAMDVPTDAAMDAPTDVAVDVPMDAPTDVAVDVPMDVAIDAPMDVPRDTPRDLPPVDAPCVITAPPLLRSPWSGSVVRDDRPNLRFVLRSCDERAVLEISRSRDFAAVHRSIPLDPGATVATLSSSMALTRGMTWFWRVRVPGSPDPMLRSSVVSEFRVAARPEELPARAGDGSVFGTLTDGDGDGFPDLAIGAPAQESPVDAGVATGHVYVLRGGAAFSSLSLAGAAVLSPPISADPGSRATYGARVTGAGDLNGDGFPDLLVASRGPQFFVHLGSRTGFGGVPVVGTIEVPGTLPPSPPVAGVGDFDGDGFCDIVAGVPVVAGAPNGYINFFRGTPTGITLGRTGGDIRPDVFYGFAIAPAGDVDGDGLGDYLEGSPANTGRGGTVGHVGLWASAGRGSRTVNPPTGIPFGPDFGRTVSAAGDLDGDGYGEMLATQGSNPPIWVANITSAPLTANPIDAMSSAAGAQLTPVGDVNADGLDDLVRWSPGGPSAIVRGGLAPSSQLGLSGLVTVGATVRAVAGVGDLDGDGRDDIAVAWRGALGNLFVTVFRVVPGALGGGDRAELLATFDGASEPRFGAALGTAF
jgi:hypothetical protein